MSVNLCIATRGRPTQLAATIQKTLDNAALPTTRAAVAIDDDDVDTIQAVEQDGFCTYSKASRALYSIARRENSLGAKYNRSAELYLADVYVLWADDQWIPTPGWDRKLEEAAAQFSDGVGVIYFGNVPGVLQPGIAVTRKYVEKVGYFCPPYFPFWWHDTWIDEIGRMIGRIICVDVEVTMGGALKGQSRGVRDILFWAEFFDAMRPLRRTIALNIIEESDDQPFRKIQLRQLMFALEAALGARNSVLRDPARAAQLESHYAFDAEANARYLAIKVEAERMMAGLVSAQRIAS
jgi:hypothetical protein